jgi:hypothetical protein
MDRALRIITATPPTGTPMLIQLLIEHPTAALTIVQRTPVWVWGLLAALVALGLSQWRDRQIGPYRAVMPSLGLAVFSLISLAGDLRGTGWLGAALAVWVAAAAAVWWAGAHRPPRPGTRYDPATQRFHLPGSPLPLLIIIGIFLIKYAVGVELVMQPALRLSASFNLTLAALYGALNGLLGLQPLMLWRMVRSGTPNLG